MAKMYLSGKKRIGVKEIMESKEGNGWGNRSF